MQGKGGGEGGGALCVEIYFARSFQASPKCNNRHSVLNNLYQGYVVGRSGITLAKAYFFL